MKPRITPPITSTKFRSMSSLACSAARTAPLAHSAAFFYFGSIFPAVWSFNLALRARGLGSVLTTLHLVRE